MAGKEKKTKKVRVSISEGVIHILCTFNNTIVTVSDLKGNALSAASSGSLGYKGAKKSTPFVAQLVATDAIEKASKYGLKSVLVHVSGPGFGRESAIKSVVKSGMTITEIRDKTGVPHNGCRPPKQRNA